MDISAFTTSLSANTPPSGVSVHLEALWYDKKDQLKKAHEIIQDINDEDASWVHAYLHRKEGDISNASYWYRRARRTLPGISLESEWKELVNALL